MEYEQLVTLTNEDKGYQFSEYVDPYGPVLDGEGNLDLGATYYAAQKEYGRCKTSVYVDTATGTKRVGWFFVSRQHYEDTNEPYLRGAWVVIRTVEPASYDYVDVGQ